MAARAGGGPSPFEIEVSDEALEDLRERLRRTRWPAEENDLGWEFGGDAGYLRELCAYWEADYDWRLTERALNGLSNWRWDGTHFIWERADRDGRVGEGGLPLLLIHGWPGGVLEFFDVIPRLVAAGHDVVVPSLPGYGFSDPPSPPLGIKGMAARMRALMEEALGFERYAVQGGDWGAPIAARMALEAPERAAALHTNALFALPAPGNLAEPPLSDAEQEYAESGRRWRLREGHHMFVHGQAPDALAVGLSDSPAGLAAWLVEKYRRWSDCDGEVERRFSKDDLCDFLTLYWATGTIRSSLRIYAAEARDRWRLGPEEAIDVPAAVADYPGEMVRPPREWAERIFTDLRAFSEMPSGGHFAAFEEPEAFADDLLAFAGDVEEVGGQG
jgi:microsomal epoxide hydrolase